MEQVEKVKEKKKQKISVSYTLKAFGGNISKLKEAKMITDEDAKTLEKIHDKAVKTWIGMEFKM